MWSILHRNLIINDTRLPKNCLSRIWFKLTVKNKRLFLGLYETLYKNYAGTLTSMLITCIIIKSYALHLESTTKNSCKIITFSHHLLNQNLKFMFYKIPSQNFVDQ